MQAEQIKDLMSGRLFKILIRVTKITKDEGRKVAQEAVKFFQDADVNWEYWQHGTMVGTMNMEFTTQFPMKPGEGEKSSEQLARICANMAWRAIGEYREPIKVKCAPFSDFCGTTTIYVVNDEVYWCDFWDEEFMASLPVEGTPVKVIL